MEGSHEKPSPQRQVNIRLSEETYQRIQTWGFLEGEARPSKFLANLIEHVAVVVGETDPDVDFLIQTAAQYRANKASLQGQADEYET